MTFQVRKEQHPNAFGLDDHVWVLDDCQGSFVEVAPPLGFNAYRWHIPEGELLYADAKFFEENKPTRSGFPILFPFPNRIRDGRFTWASKEYRLPTNDPSGKNAIHGFVCRRPWRVVAQGAGTDSAWVTGEFVGSQDAPETLALWPADYRIVVTYRLQHHSLSVLAEVSNPAQLDLPFGLGYHPYIALSLFGDADAHVSIPARKYWELIDSLPTGRQLGVNAERDARAGRRYQDLHLDDVYTDIERSTTMDGLTLVGRVRQENRRLDMYASSEFRELVGFTPPHRQAVCIEPYTCTTDAINLQQEAGVDAGWLVLNANEVFRGTVRMVYQG